jgi:peptidoglycan/LPS O-acetylase OafA/YrhL
VAVSARAAGPDQAAGAGAVKAIWVPTFDGIRGAVSLSIALTHISLATGWHPAHEPFRALRASMFFSIEFLFLVGGFVAFLPAVVHGVFLGGRAYGVRRAGRILPVYVLTIALAVALGPLLRPVTHANFPHDALAVLGHLAFLQQILFPFRAGFGVQGIVWTMTIACLFYLLYPFVVRPYFRHPLLGLLVAVAVGVAWREHWRSEPNVFLQFPLFVADFALGMSAAYFYVWLRRKETPRRRAALALACPAAFGLLLYLMYRAGLPVVARELLHLPPSYWGESAFLSVAVPMAFAGFLLTSAYLPRRAAWVLANPVARWIGDISYSIFLFHFLVIWLVLLVVPIPRDGSPSSMLELTVIVLPITLTLAWLATRYLENPLRRRAHVVAARLQRPVQLGRRPAGEGGPARRRDRWLPRRPRPASEPGRPG